MQPATTTVVSRTTRVHGAIQATGSVTVEGLLEGELEAGGTVTVAPTGTVVAEVRARAVVVFGEVIGNVTCSESIHVAAGARVVGDLRAPDIQIDSDAIIDGRVDLLPPEARGTPVARAAITLRGVAATGRRPTAPQPAVRPEEGAAEAEEWPPEGTVEESQPGAFSRGRGVPSFPRPLGRVRLRTRMAKSDKPSGEPQ